MNRFLNIILLVVMAVTFSLEVSASSGSQQSKGVKQRSIQSGAGSPANTILNINNISMWVRGNGGLERRAHDDNAGTTFPRGTSTVIYAGGVIWGGLVNDGASPVLRVGGQSYNYGTVPGRIVRRGVKENPGAPDVRPFRIRRDYATADLAQDAAEFLDKPLAQVTASDIAQIREQYKKDWLGWPWQKGAPYYDRNGSGTYDPDPSGAYDPTKDEPGLGGADQVIWLVVNDLDASAAQGLYGSPPIGIELQITLWAYARSDELGNVIFQRYRIIYKGTATTPPAARIDTMYLAKWSDPDLGDFGDDYAGCVQDKSLGYVYNSTPEDAEFKKFGLIPPVAGYDFFQGPRIPSSGKKARWDLKIIDDYENLPMTAFVFFAAGGFDSDPDLSQYEGTRQWYNLLRGFRPRPVDPPECFIDITTDQCTKYALSGDPNTLRGWIDGRRDPASDRRIVLASGPFNMALGDTQEVVVGLLGALGEDYVKGIEDLKQIDDVAQDAFNLNFELPDRVPEPTLNIIELDQKFILDWESDTAQMRKIESYDSKGYRFEGYNIYQFAGAVSSSAFKVLPPFDVTMPRSLQIDVDQLRNRPLVNGQRYYYAVTATVFNPDPALVKKRLESAIAIKTAIPHTPNAGVVYPYPENEVLDIVQNVVGVNDAVVNPVFFDPTRPDGHTYNIPFHKVGSAFAWDFIDMTVQDTLLRGMPVDTTAQRIISRGMTIEVKRVPVGIKGVFQTSYGGQQTRENIFDRPNPSGEFMIVGQMDNQGRTSIDTIKGFNLDDRDIEWRFTGDSSWAVMRGGNVPGSFWVRVPYTVWQIPKNPQDSAVQLNTVIHPVGPDNVWRAVSLLPRIYNNKPLRTFYPISIVPSRSSGAPIPYSNDTTLIVKALLWVNTGTSIEPGVAIYKVYLADLDRNGVPAPQGTVIRFEKYKSIQDGDVKTFTTKAVETNNMEAAMKEVDKIKVFPNPYYGVNRAELNRFARYVTFSHLPYYAKIRIFNLAGVLVRTIEKCGDSQFTNWDLTNERGEPDPCDGTYESGLPVASGMYIAYLELKDAAGNDLGTKILKLMIVQEQQFLDNY
ncbi:MAG: hypothetical protein HY707_03780 [Ignavibacteriae bacterium]|nr:hypothetical protein [Ignavibacteriota bacterium]